MSDLVVRDGVVVPDVLLRGVMRVPLDEPVIRRRTFLQRGMIDREDVVELECGRVGIMEYVDGVEEPPTHMKHAPFVDFDRLAAWKREYESVLITGELDEWEDTSRYVDSTTGKRFDGAIKRGIVFMMARSELVNRKGAWELEDGSVCVFTEYRAGKLTGGTERRQFRARDGRVEDIADSLAKSEHGYITAIKKWGQGK